jgi:hypothetical protein
MATDLERDLRSLGAVLELPATPDLAAGIRARLEVPRPKRRRRGLVLAFAILVAALAAAFAVPQARTAILEFFGLDGVSVTRVETLPEVDEHPEDLGLGPIVTLNEALERATFRVSVPGGDPDEVRFTDDLPGGQVSFIWRDADGEIELLLSEFRAGLDRDFVEKMTGPDTTIEQLEVNGEPALWLGGAPHAFGYRGLSDEFGQVPLRLAGPTLLWQRGAAILRLEGDLTRDEALELAEGLD